MWTLLSSSSDFVGESLIRFGESTGLAGFFSAMGWGNIVMIGIAFFLLYLAIRHKFEPLLLLTIAFGMLLTNLPGANLYHTELFAGGHVHWDIFVAKAGLLDYLYLGVKLGIYPCLIFLGVGAMTDFGPLIANPKSFLLGAAAQIGIFVTFLGAYAIGFSPEQSGSIGIIGGADGPTAIYLTSMLAPELSGGMRQRVMIAMALACNPKIIIADEPTTALDVTIQAQILDLLRSLKDRINSSIMLITHDLGVIAEMADYVVVMYAGRVVEKGTVEEIFAHPSHPYTIGLMASKPVVGKKVDRLYSIPGKVPNPVDMPNYCYFKDRCELQLPCCSGEYPCEISLSPTHKVSCYRYYEENRKAGE